MVVAAVLAAATACGTDGGEAVPGDAAAGAAYEERQEVLAPVSALPDGVEVTAEGAPESATGDDGVEYDYRGAVISVLELHSALLRGLHSEGKDEDALEWTVEGGDAHSYVRDRLDEAADSGAAPVGEYVFRDFEVGAFAPDLVQVDVCLDQSGVRLSTIGEGGEQDGHDVSGSDLLWMGYTMERGPGGTWVADTILADPADDAPEGACSA
ncbi:MAG: hypothetical protein M0026_11260 [Nocardiopsaceae bacterium]|nr:hypothetical protein [Nocardiopsaceae bacterium]